MSDEKQTLMAKKSRARRRVTFNDAYLPLEELATYAGLSVRTLRDYLHHPVTPMPHYVIGGRIVVLRSDYDEWAQRFKVADPASNNEAWVEAMVKGQ